MKPSGRNLTVGFSCAALAIGYYVLSHDEGRDDSPRTIKVPATTIVRVPTETDSRLVLQEDPGLHPGDFVTTVPDWEAPNPHAPEGFLLKVEEVGTDDGVTIATTQPASPFEAFPEGKIVVSGSAGFRPLPETEQETGVFALARFAADEEPKRAGWFSKWLSESFKCERRSEEIELKPKLVTKLKPELRLDWKRTGRLTVRLNEAAAWVTGSIEAEIGLQTKGLHECKLKPKPLWSPSWTIFVPVHGVPVPVTLKLPVRVEAKAAAGAKAVARASAVAKAQAGVIYERGREKPVRTEKGVVLKGPTFSPEFETKASAEGALVPGIEIVAGWSIPYLGKLALLGETKFRGAVGVDYDVAKSQRRICATAKVTSALYWQAPFTRKPRPLSKKISLYKEEHCKPPKPKGASQEDGI